MPRTKASTSTPATGHSKGSSQVAFALGGLQAHLAGGAADPAQHEAISARQPSGEQAQALLPVAIFEALDQIAHGLRIACHGPRPVIGWRRGNRCRLPA